MEFVSDAGDEDEGEGDEDRNKFEERLRRKESGCLLATLRELKRDRVETTEMTIKNDESTFDETIPFHPALSVAQKYPFSSNNVQAILTRPCQIHSPNISQPSTCISVSFPLFPPLQMSLVSRRPLRISKPLSSPFLNTFLLT